MHPDTRNMAAHMRAFGLSALGRAICDATYAEITKPFAHALSVVQAAHGAEIVVKARIAEEHPLLIFDKLPSSGTTAGQLTITELLEPGRSLDYADLPETLWAATGIRLAKTQEFLKFGKIRNQIMHLGVPEAELADETPRFCFGVMEPAIQDFWNESLVPYAEAGG